MSIVTLLFGLAIMAVGGYSYVTESAALEDSVAVPADITATSVAAVESSRGNDAYVPVVTYQYRFRGTGYSSDRIYPGQAQPRYADRATAAEQLAPYTVGERVTAYVDPDAPGQAFLEASRSGLALGSVAAGLFVSLLAAVGLYHARREARARERLS